VRGDDVARDTNHEQVAQILIEHDFGRYPRIGATQNDGEGRLRIGQRTP
jgi:hypothetical protein